MRIKSRPPSWSKDAVVETRINLVRVPSETIRQCHFDNHPRTTLLSLKKLFTLISSIVPSIHSAMYRVVLLSCAPEDMSSSRIVSIDLVPGIVNERSWVMLWRGLEKFVCSEWQSSYPSAPRDEWCCGASVPCHPPPLPPPQTPQTNSTIIHQVLPTVRHFLYFSFLLLLLLFSPY